MSARASASPAPGMLNVTAPAASGVRSSAAGASQSSSAAGAFEDGKASPRPATRGGGSQFRGERVFFDDARVHDDDRVGNEGDGWRIAMTTLSFERDPGNAGLGGSALPRVAKDSRRPRTSPAWIARASHRLPSLGPRSEGVRTLIAEFACGQSAEGA